jgi:uncharacterized protein
VLPVSCQIGFTAVTVIVAIVAGGISSVAGFGIGSILTPLIAMRYGMKIAVSVVAVPHAIATLIRFCQMHVFVDRRVFFGFGLTNAVGALLGAVIHIRVTSPFLTVLLGALLVFAGTLGVTGYANNLRCGRRTSWFLGALSGAFGGLVGNQGGIRSAALLEFRLGRDAFVATATAIALAVDAVRIPIYLAIDWRQILRAWPAILSASVGVISGTLVGVGVLRCIPERIFRRIVSLILLAIGVTLLVR